jgi:hypothetical protein
VTAYQRADGKQVADLYTSDRYRREALEREARDRVQAGLRARAAEAQQQAELEPPGAEP